MKKGDIVVIAIGLLLAIGIYFAYQLVQVNSEQKRVVVKSNGTVIASIEIDATTSASYTVDNEYGQNYIVIAGGNVYMSEADCKNQICVNDGQISEVGQSIICLPNRVAIEIIGVKKSGIDDVSY